MLYIVYMKPTVPLYFATLTLFMLTSHLIGLDRVTTYLTYITVILVLPTSIVASRVV